MDSASVGQCLCRSCIGPLNVISRRTQLLVVLHQREVVSSRRTVMNGGLGSLSKPKRMKCCCPPASANEAAATSEQQGAEALTPVTFQTQLAVTFGDSVRVVGNAEPLGCWNPAEALELQWHEGDWWRGGVGLESGGDYAFKVVVYKRPSGSAVWEEGGDRELQIPPGSPALQVCCCWGDTTATSIQLLTDSSADMAALAEESESLNGALVEDLGAPVNGSGGPALPPETDAEAVDLQAVVDAVLDPAENGAGPGDTASLAGEGEEGPPDAPFFLPMGGGVLGGPLWGEPFRRPSARDGVIYKAGTMKIRRLSSADGSSLQEEEADPQDALLDPPSTPMPDPPGPLPEPVLALNELVELQEVPEASGKLQVAAVLVGLVALPVVALSEYTLHTTGCGLPPGPAGSVGALEGCSYLALLGLVGWSLKRKAGSGVGLATGPGGLVGVVEGVSWGLLATGLVVLGLQYQEYGYIPSALPDANCFGDTVWAGSLQFPGSQVVDDMQVAAQGAVESLEEGWRQLSSSASLQASQWGTAAQNFTSQAAATTKALTRDASQQAGALASDIGRLGARVSTQTAEISAQAKSVAGQLSSDVFAAAEKLNGEFAERSAAVGEQVGQLSSDVLAAAEKQSSALAERGAAAGRAGSGLLAR